MAFVKMKPPVGVTVGLGADGKLYYVDQRGFANVDSGSVSKLTSEGWASVTDSAPGKSLDPVFAQVDPVTGGIGFSAEGKISAGRGDIFAYDMDAGLADNGPILQAWIDKVKAKAAADGHTRDLPRIVVPSSAGVFMFATGIQTAPWIKIEPIHGRPIWDFSSMPSTGTAVKCNGDATPVGELNGGAHFGAQIEPYLRNVVIRRTTTKGTSVGIDLGQPARDTTGVKMTREAYLKDVDVIGFHINQFVRKTDTYLCLWEGCRLLTADFCLYTEDGTSNNAGEKMVFRGGVIGVTSTGIGCYFGTSGTEWAFDTVSFDYAYKNAIKINCAYLTLNLQNPHLENSCDDGFIKSVGAGTNVFVNISGQAQLVPLVTPGTSGAFADGSGSAWQSLFKGPMTVSLSGLAIQGFDNYHNAATESNMFLCDTSVVLDNAESIRFTNFSQLISRSLVCNKNSNFSGSTVGDDLRAIGGSGGIIAAMTYFAACVISADRGFGASSNSLKITSSDPGCYAILHHQPFPVIPGLGYRAQPVVYGNGAGGVLNCQTQFLWYALGASAAPVAISSITRTNSIATVTTTQPHGLVTGQYVSITGASPVEYNRRVYITVTSATTFTYLCNNASANLTTPATITGAAYTVEPLIPIGSSGTDTNGFAAQYADSAQPGYTSGSAYWAKGKYCSKRIAPAGAAFAVIQTNVSGINSGGAVYLGDIVVTPS